jgi:uncharacterized protein YjbI with pentapeptide repeats
MEFTGDLRRRDFSGQDLTGAQFRDADLCRASFAGANLPDALFLDCFAAEANFENANCAGLQASESNFYRADFRGASLREALFLRCVLAAADLRGAELKHLTVTLDCNSFEDVCLDRAAGAELAYLFGRARSPQRERWLEICGERDLARLDGVFQR